MRLELPGLSGTGCGSFACPVLRGLCCSVFIQQCPEDGEIIYKMVNKGA